MKNIKTETYDFQSFMTLSQEKRVNLQAIRALYNVHTRSNYIFLVIMRDFLKYTLATLAGLFIFGFITFICLLFSIIGMFSTSETTEIADHSVLVLKLNGTLADHTIEDNDVMSMLMGQVKPAQGLDNIRKAIQKAKECEQIKGIYIETNTLEGSPATLQSLRDLLLDFKKTGKFVVAYADTYQQGAYYVASAADKVWINPKGMLSWHGLSTQPQFIRDFLDKVGVKIQVVKVGQYKSATETFTEDHMSDANREQVSVYLNGIWDRMLSDVSKSRKISTDSLNAYADQVMEFSSTKEYKQKGLIDATLYPDQIKGEIKKLLKIADEEAIAQVSVSQMVDYASIETGNSDQIAVYYCEGSIVQQEVQGVLMGDAGIVGPTVCRDIEALAKDDNVKAVVIRINSGGGDAYASEQMWHQIMELKKVKPVVVSMGGMAASGGYYMSCAASWIVAEPTTLTGSIGIFGTFPDAHKLMTEKLGFKYDKVITNKHSDMSITPMARAFSDDEIALLQKYINRGYATFLQRVAEGRKMKTADVDKIAQGRVWLGKDALKIRLVDQLGSIDDAIAKAAKLAKMQDYSICSYPIAKDWTENLFSEGRGGSYLDEQMRLLLGEYYEPFSIMHAIRSMTPVQARMLDEVIVR